MKILKKPKLGEKYKLNVHYSDKDLIFLIDDIENEEIKLYKLKTSFENLKNKNEDFYLFQSTQKFIDIIDICIESNNFSIKLKKKNILIFEIKNDFFKNKSLQIEIPEFFIKYDEELENLKENIFAYQYQSKDYAALKSFKGSEILDDSDKILISKWIHPHKIIKFNLLFSTNKDGDSASTFHYYCDGISPTVVIVKEENSYKMKFGGYTTHTWLSPYNSSCQSRAPGSFLFNLTKKEKYELNDQFNQCAIYKQYNLGPIFGYSNNNADLYLYNGSTSYCNKYSYNSGNNNIIGQSGKTSFAYKVYEVYQVIFE